MLDQKVVITLDKTYEVIYTSPIIKVGFTLIEDKLQYNLKQGVYYCKAWFYDVSQNISYRSYKKKIIIEVTDILELN